MEKGSFAKLANCQNSSQDEEKTTSKLRKAILTLVKELNIKNGSFKVFVHDGRPGARIEVQNKVLTDI